MYCINYVTNKTFIKSEKHVTDTKFFYKITPITVNPR